MRAQACIYLLTCVKICAHMYTKTGGNMIKREKVSVHVKIDKEVWKRTQEIIDEMGFTNSGFVEMLFRQMIKAETSPLGDMIEGILKDLFDRKIASKKGKN